MAEIYLALGDTLEQSHTGFIILLVEKCRKNGCRWCQRGGVESRYKDIAHCVVWCGYYVVGALAHESQQA